MNEKPLVAALALALLLGLGGCSGMSQQDQNTAVGAGVGAVGGALLTGGNAIGTIGGAAVGGVIGNRVNTNRHPGDQARFARA
jgi:osmotically inducible lipoprotein OsmB